jgi:hypothetical protein
VLSAGCAEYSQEEILADCDLTTARKGKTMTIRHPDTRQPAQTPVHPNLVDSWRREVDSNPRYGFPYSGFQVFQLEMMAPDRSAGFAPGTAINRSARMKPTVPTRIPANPSAMWW